MKWIWNDYQMEINPVVWLPRYDYAENDQKRILTNGQQVTISKERKFSNITIQAAFDKLTNEQKNFLHSLIGKEFWVETDVGLSYDAEGRVATPDLHNQWKVRIASFEPRWNMSGYPGRYRRFDIAMELEVVSPYAKEPLTINPGSITSGSPVYINVGGTFETWKVFIQVEGIVSGSTNIGIAHEETGRFIGYPYELPNGAYLIFNMDSFTATLEGKDVTHEISGRFFPLQVGMNTLRFDIGGAGIVSAQVVFYPCYM